MINQQNVFVVTSIDTVVYYSLKVTDYCSFVGMSFSSPDMLHSPLAAGVKQRETHTLFTSQDLPTRLLSYMIALLTVTQGESSSSSV